MAAVLKFKKRLVEQMFFGVRARILFLHSSSSDEEEEEEEKMAAINFLINGRRNKVLTFPIPSQGGNGKIK